MGKEIKKLILTARPHPDESFMGYIVRLTELNEYKTPAWILEMSGLNPNLIHMSCSFAFSKAIDVSLLAQLSGVDSEQLLALTYPSLNKSDSPYTSSIFGLPVPKYVIHLREGKVCPQCLLESPYCRKVWDLAPVTACPIHKCLLIDRCPACRRALRWGRNKVSVCNCRYDWRNNPPVEVEESELAVTRQIHKLCGLPLHGSMISSLPLSTLSLEHFLMAIFFIASQYEGFIDTKGKILASSRFRLELHSLINKAHLVFEEWPNKFWSFLDWRRELMSNRQFYGGLRKDFGDFTETLYGQLALPEFDFMRVAFEEYLERSWDGGYVGSIKRLAGRPLTQRKYMSGHEARRRLKAFYPRLDRLIEGGKLKAVVRNFGGQKFRLLEIASIEEYRRELEDLIGLQIVAALLGIGPTQVLDLVDHECIKPSCGRDVDGSKIWKFNRKEVTRFFDLLPKKRCSDNESSPVR